jgi:hypothetical protein
MLVVTSIEGYILRFKIGETNQSVEDSDRETMEDSLQDFSPGIEAITRQPHIIP